MRVSQRFFSTPKNATPVGGYPRFLEGFDDPSKTPFLHPRSRNAPFHVSPHRGAAIGVHGWYLFLVLQRQSDKCTSWAKISEQTYVLKVLKALLDAVITGTCFSGSQARIERCKSLSSAGDLSTMYDIQACLSRSVRACVCFKLASHTSLALFVTWKAC